MRRRGIHGPVRAALVAGGILAAGPAGAFSVLSDDGVSAVSQTLAEAQRWNAEPIDGVGLHDGIQVAVSPTFASDLGAVEPSEFALVRDAVEKAFRPWENAVLRFEIEHDSPRAQLGAEMGAEIDLFALPASHPVFADFGEVFGLAVWEDRFVPDRRLTNGQRSDGYVITGAEVYVNLDTVLQAAEDFGVPLGVQLIALTRLMMHEIGHALGLAHPNEEGRFFDTDLDPTNTAVVDPDDPFAGLRVSPNFDPGAIMDRNPCGEVTPLCDALFFFDLQPDDRLGRDVLYPVPEPGTAALLAGALVALAAGRRVPRRRVGAADAAAPRRAQAWAGAPWRWAALRWNSTASSSRASRRR